MAFVGVTCPTLAAQVGFSLILFLLLIESLVELVGHFLAHFQDIVDALDVDTQGLRRLVLDAVELQKPVLHNFDF